MDPPQHDSDSLNQPRGLDAFLANLPRTVLDNFMAASNMPKPPPSPSSKRIANREQRVLRKVSSTPTFRPDAEESDRGSGLLGKPTVMRRSVSHEQMGASSDDFPSLHLLFLPLLHILPEDDALSASLRSNMDIRRVDVRSTPPLLAQPLIAEESDGSQPSPGSSLETMISSSDAEEFKCQDTKSEATLSLNDDDFCSTTETFSLHDPIMWSVDRDETLQIESPVLEKTLQERKLKRSKAQDSAPQRSAFDALYKVLMAEENDREANSCFSLNTRLALEFDSLEPDQPTVTSDDPVQTHVYASPYPVDQILPGLSFESSKNWLCEPKRAGKIMKSIQDWPISRSGIIKMYESTETKQKRKKCQPKWVSYYVEVKSCFLFFYPPERIVQQKSDERIPPMAYLRLSEKSTVDISYRYLEFNRYILSIIRVGNIAEIPKMMNEPEVNFLELASQQKMISWALDIRNSALIKQRIVSIGRSNKDDDEWDQDTPESPKASLPMRMSSRSPMISKKERRRGRIWNMKHN